MAILHTRHTSPHKPAPTRKEDGNLYRWRMFYELRRNIVEADNLHELLQVLWNGYPTHAGDAQKQARIDLAHRVQSYLRVNSMVLWEQSEISSLEDWEFRVLISFSSSPHGWAEVDFWKSEIPLILVRSDYQPHSNVVAPVSEGMGNIVWLDPSSELDLLTDLHRTHYIELEKLTE